MTHVKHRKNTLNSMKKFLLKRRTKNIAPDFLSEYILKSRRFHKKYFLL